MILAVLLSLAVQEGARPEPYRPTPATIVAEPVAVFLAGLDADGDGRTTLAEMREGLTRVTRDDAWRAGVGYIPYSDWAERWLGNRNAVPTPFDIDRDGDNRITTAELSDRFEAVFTRLDADHDGVLTRAELLTVRATPIGNPDGGEGRRRNRPR